MRHIEITIKARPKMGKTALALLLKKVLRPYGCQVELKQRFPDSTTILLKKADELEEVLTSIGPKLKITVIEEQAARGELEGT